MLLIQVVKQMDLILIDWMIYSSRSNGRKPTYGFHAKGHVALVDGLSEYQNVHIFWPILSNERYSKQELFFINQKVGC